MSPILHAMPLPVPAIRAHPPTWVWLALLLFAVAQAVNSWQEVRGPGSVGVVPTETGFAVETVTPGLPLDVAGVRAGDVIESVDGYSVAGMPDWFIVRANFERDVATPIRVRRDDVPLDLSFVIHSSNWDQWYSLTFAFQATRWVVLAFAAWLLHRRPRQPSAWWLALILASIAVTEGNPSAGWLVILRDLPFGFGAVVGLMTTSWLALPAMWLAFCHAFPRPMPWPRTLAGLTLGYAGAVGLLVSWSLVCLIFRPAGTAMPTTFDDVGATRVVASLFSVTPQLFLNPMRWYTPDGQAAILAAWLATTATLLAAGLGALLRARERLPHGADRRRLTMLLGGFGCSAIVGVHNVLARNWTWLSTPTPPAWLDDSFVAAEGMVFALVAAGLVYAVARQGEDALPTRSSWTVANSPALISREQRRSNDP
jgi:hypothetical protein